MSKSKFALIGSSKFSNHVTPPGHPERIERAEVMDAVARHWEVGDRWNSADLRCAGWSSFGLDNGSG